MAPHGLVALSNPLVSVEQLESTASQDDGVSPDLERSLRYHGALLTQAAGILLKLPQEVVAQAIVIFSRFYVGSDGGSFRAHSFKDVSAACLYLTAKLSFQPQTTRALLNVYAYLTSSLSPLLNEAAGLPGSKPADVALYTLTEGEYFSARATLLQSESLVLRTLSYITHVALPHPLALTYLQTLGLVPPAPTEQSHALAKRTLELLNSALLSPQLLYLTHQPNALAVAAIYLAARETAVKLADGQWWCVWDVGREELGFLVLSMGSLQGFAEQEKERWAGSSIPLTAGQVDAEVKKGEHGEAEGGGER